MRRLVDALSVSSLACCTLALAVPGLAGCDRADEPVSVAPSPTASGSGASARDLRAVAAASPSAAVAAQMLPVASRDPDWGLDPNDPARDYVGRYLRATRRYGAQTPCVVVRPSTFADGKSTVETRNDASGTCGAPDELRDRFFVKVATDRMSLDASLHQPPLQKWPDGSDPEGPAAKVSDGQDLRAWKASLGTTIRALQLVPLRIQLYGRGTFPVVSLAGWHGPVMRDMTPAQLATPAKALCLANDGEPMGFFAGLDRSTLLRITCPGSATFEKL
jgi:hypothetical protein